MSDPAERTVIVDLRIPFWRLVMFFIKSFCATLVAGIVIGAVLMLLSAVVAALFGTQVDLMMQRWRL